MMHTFPFMEEGALFGNFQYESPSKGAQVGSGWTRSITRP